MKHQFIFPSSLALIFLLNCGHLIAQVHGCLYKYNSGDRRIFTTAKGNVTYMDNGVTITAPGYVGSVAGRQYSTTIYTNEQCVSPNPAGRAGYTSNCVIDDTGGSNIKYPGYLVEYAVNCNLDGFSYCALLIMGIIGYKMLITKRRLHA